MSKRKNDARAICDKVFFLLMELVECRNDLEGMYGFTAEAKRIDDAISNLNIACENIGGKTK